MLLPLLLASAFAASPETLRLRIDGEWCFLKIPANRRPHDAVLAIHGNGQTVTATSSSFEEGAPFRRLMQTLLDQGYLIAQSNHGATADNGMWGNARTQSSPSPSPATSNRSMESAGSTPSPSPPVAPRS